MPYSKMLGSVTLIVSEALFFGFAVAFSSVLRTAPAQPWRSALKHYSIREILLMIFAP